MRLLNSIFLVLAIEVNLIGLHHVFFIIYVIEGLQVANDPVILIVAESLEFLDLLVETFFLV